MQHASRGQGATQLCCRTTYCPLLGQGATEYLVVLAVVLVVALVGIALLGFFPGTVTESQITESEIYWKSATPLAVVEFANPVQTDKSPSCCNCNYIYMKVRNTGAYPVRLGKLWNAGIWIDQYNDGGGNPHNLSEIYIPPGAEICLGGGGGFPYCPYRIMVTQGYGSGHGIDLSGERLICFAADSSPLCSGYGPVSNYLMLENFGFEYTQYVEGQAIVKKQIGAKPIVQKCQIW